MLLNLFLAFVWVGVTSRFTFANLLLGYLLGYIALAFGGRTGGRGPYLLKVRRSISFLLYYAKEVVVATLMLTRNIYSPIERLRPAILAVPLRTRDELEIALIANLITFTPGNLSLDVSDDRQTLYVHVLDCRDPVSYRDSIKEGYETKVMRMFE